MTALAHRLGLRGEARLEIASGGHAPGRVVKLCPVAPATDELPAAFDFWLDQALATAPAGARELAAIENGGRRPALVEHEGRLLFLFDPARAIDALHHERYFAPRRPLHTRLPIPYQVVPGEWRLRAFRWLADAARPAGEGFPRWPVDDAADALAATWLAAWLRAGGERAPGPAWPEGRTWAFTVSHDVDTPAGLQRAPELAAWEAARGLRAGWFVVGDVMERDGAAVEAIRAAGHELGLHGDRHDNRLGYEGRATIGRRLDRCAPLVARFGLAGFRAPSLLETPLLREELRARFTYASQVPDTEVHSLIAARRGCATLRPFWRDGLLEIPITLPLDDKLLIAGCGEREIIAAWRDKIAAIRQRGGLAQLVVHNEPHLLARCRGAFEQIVEETRADASAWHATPGEVARFWRETRGDD